MHFHALLCTIVHYHALSCTILHFAALRCTAVHFIEMQYTAKHFSALWCTSVHFGALWCTSVHFGALWCTFVHFSAILCNTKYFRGGQGAIKCSNLSPELNPKSSSSPRLLPTCAITRSADAKAYPRSKRKVEILYYVPTYVLESCMYYQH